LKQKQDSDFPYSPLFITIDCCLRCGGLISPHIMISLMCSSVLLGVTWWNLY